ncbi:hypothetical protein ACTFIY_003127 [Dictyostelium cf. discoideum]
MQSTARFIKLFNDYLASLSLEIGSLTGDDKENIIKHQLAKPADWGELSLKNIILNYISEISHTIKVDKLFVQWCARSNKYKNQAMGVHTISDVPQDLAKHLNLPDPESYTSHSLRVSSATALAESGGTILQLKSHGGWSSDKAAEGYIRVSKKAKTDVASKLIQGEDASTQLSLPLPSAPGVSNDPISNDPVSTDQMCEPVGKSDAPHNNKLSLNKTSNTTKYNSPTKIKGEHESVKSEEKLEQNKIIKSIIRNFLKFNDDIIDDEEVMIELLLQVPDFLDELNSLDKNMIEMEDFARMMKEEEKELEEAREYCVLNTDGLILSYD